MDKFVDRFQFPEEGSRFQQEYPNSFVFFRGNKAYRCELLTPEAYEAMKIALQQGIHTSQEVPTARLDQKAHEIDSQSDLETRMSSNPIAMMLLNMDYFWPEWCREREGIYVERYRKSLRMTAEGRSVKKQDAPKALEVSADLDHSEFWRSLETDRGMWKLLYTLEVTKREASLPFDPARPRYFIHNYWYDGCIIGVQMNLCYANDIAVREAIQGIQIDFTGTEWNQLASAVLNDKESRANLEAMLKLHMFNHILQDMAGAATEPAFRIQYSKETGLIKRVKQNPEIEILFNPAALEDMRQFLEEG